MIYNYPPYSSLVSQLNDNYELAISYYKQKEQAFSKALDANSITMLQSFQTSITKKAQEFNQYVRKAAYELVSTKGKGINKMKQAAAAKHPQFKIILNDLYKDLKAHNWTLSSSKNSNGYSMAPKIGEAFENFMSNYCLSAEQINDITQLINKDFPNAGIHQLLSYEFGQINNPAFTVQRSTWSRTDTLLSKYKIPKGQLENVQVEFTTALDLEKLTSSSHIYATNFLNDFINDFAMSNDNIDINNLFGFQVKSYKNLQNGKWAQSKPLADLLKEAMDNNKVWSSNYAVNYPIYFLSRFLFNIINPVNIGVITLGGLEYMSDFLSHVRFFMEVYFYKVPGQRSVKSTPERGGGYETYVTINNTQIFLKHFTNGTFRGYKTTTKDIKSKSGKKELVVAQMVYNK